MLLHSSRGTPTMLGLTRVGDRFLGLFARALPRTYFPSSARKIMSSSVPPGVRTTTVSVVAAIASTSTVCSHLNRPESAS